MSVMVVAKNDNHVFVNDENVPFIESFGLMRLNKDTSSTQKHKALSCVTY